MTNHPTTPARGFSGMVAITATYVYFLLFAQYGFIRLIGERGGTAADVDRAMLIMGLSGLLASFGAALLLARHPYRRILQISFLGCAAAAVLSLAPVPGGMELSALLVGSCTGVLTVALATRLRSLLPGPGFGLRAGTATGFAYWICNIPALFDGDPGLQVAFSAGICLAGWLAITRSRSLQEPDEAMPACPALQDGDMRGAGFASIVLSLLALVWLDSTAFATIQHTMELKGRTWAGPAQQWIMGATHFAFAVIAGWLADRGLFRGLLLGSFASFAVAFRLLDLWGAHTTIAGPLYAAGISTYSVALILFPSSRPEARGLVSARWRSAILYGVAGWLGSALGVGMAQHLHRIPAALVWSAFAVIAAGIALSRWSATRQALRLAALPLLGLAAGGALYRQPVPVPAAGSPEQRGRQVYIREGCITCHSQYIRPLTRDVKWWGPYREPDFTEKPPLIGNRRQGPDLMNAGLRRNADWHRRHLQEPRALIPGSRMPSYAHLFAEGRTDGEDLVAYLGALGRDHLLERASFILAWQPKSRTHEATAEHGRLQFQRYCAPCHGPTGAGDGPEAHRFFRPAMNLRKGFWQYNQHPAGSHAEEVALARTIRFGIPGTAMAGHELFSSRQVEDLVAYLKTFRTNAIQSATAANPGL